MLESERPRERLLNDGVESLSNEELLSIIIKTGTKNISVKELSRNILKELNNINDLKDITINKLINIKGIGKVKAIEIIASIELGKRVYIQNNKEEVTLNNSSKIYEYFKNIFINEKQENFYAIYLNTKSKLISYKLLFKGTINTSCVHPREIFKYAFLESAYSVVVIHNHPSGDPTPSKMDDELTQVLFNIGKVMSLPILDHIIIGNNKYYSYYEEMNRK
ncbi:MAG: DNA repair protein RadC [Bacilli bacterium]|nr:DNA repair protein RadC [Bacilli bacterium]